MAHPVAMQWQEQPWYPVLAGLGAGVVFFALFFFVSGEGWVYSLLIGALWFLGMWFGERRRLKRRATRRAQPRPAQR